MDDQLTQTIQEAYAQLPADMKKAVTSLPVRQIMEGVAQKNRLHIDQAGDLYTETILVLLGLQKVNSFVSNIQKHLGLSADVAAVVAQDINDQVFVGVRTSLQQIAAETEEAEREAAAAPTAQPEEAPSDRDALLAEIEDHAASLPSSQPQGQAQNQVVANNFISGKLTQTVSLPSGQAAQAIPPAAQPATPPAPPAAPKPSYTSDPYRESI